MLRLVAQVEVSGELAVSRVVFLAVEEGNVRRADLHHVGAELCKRAAGARPGDDACHVHDANARERPVAGGKRLRAGRRPP